MTLSEADPRIEAFFSADGPWQATLSALRVILRDCPVAEEFKWRSPVYTAEGGNVAILWGFKDHAALGFFKGVLLPDPAGLLVAPGENSRSARMVTFTDPAQVTAQADTLRAYVDAAVEVERQGLKVAFPKDDLAYPEELTDRLEGDPAFRVAFEALTPGRRRGYVLHFAQAKQPSTRVTRIDRAAPRILAGKGLQDR